MTGEAPRPGGATGHPGPRPGPTPRTADSAPLLALVLSSEDALFRDPFADFIPRSR